MSSHSELRNVVLSLSVGPSACLNVKEFASGTQSLATLLSDPCQKCPVRRGPLTFELPDVKPCTAEDDPDATVGMLIKEAPFVTSEMVKPGFAPRTTTS